MRRKSLRYKKGKLLISAVIIYVVLLLISITLAYLFRGPLFAYLINIKTLNNDTVTDTASVQATLIKTEYLLRASVDGRVDLLVQDGERVSKSAAVADINALSIDNPAGSVKTKVFAPAAGTFCAHLDGLENILTPDAVNVLDISQIDTIKTELTTNVNNDDITENGQPIGKVVDNLKPLFIYLNSNEHIPAELLENGGTVKLKYKDTWFDAQVIKAEIKKQSRVILLSSTSYPDDLVHRRNVEFQLMREELTGMLVSNGSLVYKNGRPGLYILYKQKIMWSPVEVQGVLNNKTAIYSSNLTNGTSYIENPHLVNNDDQI